MTKTEYYEALAKWEAKQQEPWDWQDKLVTGAALVSIVAFLVLMVMP